MKFRKRLMVGLLVTALSLTGCSSLAGDKWAAKVNGEKILASDVDARLEPMKSAYEKMGMDFSSEEGKKAVDELKAQLVEVLIGSKIVNQEVTKLALKTDDEAVNKEIGEFKKNFNSDDEYTQWLEARGMTEAELRENMALYTHVTKDVKVSDDEIRQFFDQNVALFGGQPEQVKARHIVVEKEDDAKALIKELKALPSDQLNAKFAELAKEKSTEPAAKESGGDLGYFAKEDMLPEFSEAAFAQKVGVVSDQPVKSQFGYHVILVEDHKKATTPNFEDVKDQAKQYAQDAAEQQKVESYFLELRNNAKIDYEKGFEPAKS